MTTPLDPDLIGLKQDLLVNMVEYREECAEEAGGGYPYHLEDVQACDVILSQYLERIRQPSDGDRKTLLLDAIRSTILELNDLNDRCSSPIIETMEREMIVELLVVAAVRQGLPADLGDFTLEWRNW